MRILSAIVNLSELSIDPANVRKTGRGKEPKFAASIRVRGVLEPLIVTAKIMGRPLTDREKLENIDWAMTHCDHCEEWIGWGRDICPHCGHHNLTD